MRVGSIGSRRLLLVGTLHVCTLFLAAVEAAPDKPVLRQRTDVFAMQRLAVVQVPHQAAAGLARSNTFQDPDCAW